MTTPRKLAESVSNLSESVSRLAVVQQQQGIRLVHMESIPQNNTDMVGKIVEDLRKDILESRTEILNSLLMQSPRPTSMRFGSPSFQDSENVNELTWQTDLCEMKQMLTSIQKDVQSLKAQRSDYDGTTPDLRSSGRVSAKDDGESQTNLAKHVQQKRNQLMISHGIPQLWAEFENEITNYEDDNIYQSVLTRRLTGKGFWHWALRSTGHEHLLPSGPPKSALAEATSSRIFILFQTLLILSNTIFIGFEADSAIRGVRKEPPEEPAPWLSTTMFVYNIVFTVELAFRLIALRGWFWVAGRDWAWNVFDFALVAVSLVSDVLLTGLNISFVRILRILRVVRVARIIRVLRAFRQLRQMLFSILACLNSLVWAFVFLVLLMFMFSIFFLQGLTNTVADLDMTSEHAEKTQRQISAWFGSLDQAMLSLLAAVTGGTDWLVLKETLDHAGWIYGLAFIVYLLFVTVGVMNVLTGVFLSNADDFFDADLIGQVEQAKVEVFIDHVLQLYSDIDLDHAGVITWKTFHTALKDERVRAFLASMKLEPTHVRLLFDLLDENRTGLITMNDFVMAMVRLRGEAKAIDVRIIQREISMIPLLLGQWPDSESQIVPDRFAN